MKLLISIVALIGLGLTVIPAILVFNGKMDPDMNKNLMTVGTVIWFIAAPLWFRKNR